MAYWLLKSEPDVWSWAQQTEKKIGHWDGVRNHQAARNLKDMKNGDLALFYHSNIGREVVGIVEIVREAYPDPTDVTGRFVMVDVRAKQSLKRPVTLASIKADPVLSQMGLVRQSRLSVVPVSAQEWQRVLELGGVS